ncbi:MAG: hypothetical protein HGA44_12500, partial [Cellulomonadaceae bacterium]|nr:hypothetical protein [Cellulomonadaceae bacterium]
MVDNITADFGPGETDLAEALVAAGKAPEELITEFLADIYSVDPIYLNETRFDPDLTKRIPEEMARKFILIPVLEEGRLFHIAMSISLAIQAKIKDESCDDGDIEKRIALEIVEDERDRLVGLKASQVGFGIAGAGLAMCGFS